MKQPMNETMVEAAYKPLRVYPNVDCELSYQNFGSAYLCILRGSAENIDSVFNGFFNFGATNGKYSFCDAAQTVAVFWSAKHALRRFFFNKYFIPRFDVNKRCNLKIARQAMHYALSCLEALKNAHETLMNFGTKYEPYEYAIGKVSAERPDDDFRDSVLTHAFKQPDFNATKNDIEAI